MKWSLWLVFVLGVTGCVRPEPLAETTVEHVAVDTVDLPGRLWDPFLPGLDEGRPATVNGWLTIPATDGPVPAVIVEHGCGGPGEGEKEWTRDLADAGIATLLLDSFQGRGIAEVCSGIETVNVASLIVDVYRAAEILEEHPLIDSSKLAVMGFSFGGRTALWSAMTRFQETYAGRSFAGYVAFYPSTCFIQLADERISGGPILILHGSADDWTPIGPCRDLTNRWASQGVDVRLLSYEGAHHSFDNRALGWATLHLSLGIPSPRACTFLEREGRIIDPDTGDVAGVGSPCVESGVHYGYDSEAREQARSDLLDFLAGIFG